MIPNPHNILYWINKDNLENSRPGIGLSDSQYKNWEAAFQNWIQTHGIGNLPSIPPRPTNTDDVHRPEFAPTITIDTPQPGNSFPINQEVTIHASATGIQPIQKFEYYLNDQFIGSNDGTVGNFSFTPADFISPGPATIKVVAVDSVYNRGQSTIDTVITP